VEIRPRYGVYVRERSMTELHELFEARSGLESQIAALAAERRTDEELATLRDIVDAGRTAARDGDMDATADASIRFNQVMRAACKNSVLAVLSASLEKRARFYFAMIEGRLGADWVSVEQELVERLTERDSQGAATAAREHIRDTGEEVSKLLSSQE
jgi:DNA-binding GntR family transcriptional regulator